jgi:N6-L-threonylcarbamoyladenine synthase
MNSEEAERLPDIQPFSVPMPGKLAFSFASLQSSVDRNISIMQGPLSTPHKMALARTFQTAAANQLCAKLTLGLQKLELKGVKVRDVVVSGGVASNAFLRERRVANA